MEKQQHVNSRNIINFIDKYIFVDYTFFMKVNACVLKDSDSSGSFFALVKEGRK